MIEPGRDSGAAVPDETSVVLGDLVSNPGWFDPLTALSISRFGYMDGSSAVTSFVVPVFNQALVIGSNLESIRRNAITRHEFVVIVDGCTDGTSSEVRAWASGAVKHGGTCGVTVVEAEQGIFETLSDSVGIRLATGEHVIEVQADMSIDDPGFDLGMSSALELHPELIVIGGRGAHSFAATGLAPRPSRFSERVARRLATASSRRLDVYSPSTTELRLSDSIGRVGDLIDVTRVNYPSRLFVHETTMRGPWAVRRQDFLDLDGFDTERFFLGNDDHDFALRALLHGGRRTAFLPIRFASPLELGSTRAPRPADAAQRFGKIRAHYANVFPGSVLAQRVSEVVRPKRFSVEHDWRRS